jgi:capsid protein
MDAQATREAIAAGLMSRRQAVAALGYDVAQLDLDIASDRAREAALGLAFGPPAAEEPTDAD